MIVEDDPFYVMIVRFSPKAIVSSVFNPVLDISWLPNTHFTGT